LVYLNPRPTKTLLGELYKTEFTKEQGGPIHNYENFLKKPGWHTMCHRLSKLNFIKKYSKGRKLLDIGCACGIFMHIAEKQGYDVQGIEISDESANIAKEKFNLKVRQDNFSETGLEPSSFDVVTMWDVLEHSFNPLADLKGVYGLLRPEGLLAIQAPNLRGLDATILKKDWGWLQLPYHLYFFTPYNLRKLVEKAGFKVLAVRTYHLDLWDILLRKVFKRYDGGGQSQVIKFYDKKKDAKTLGTFFVRQLKNILFIISICVKILIYPFVILAKRGSLVQIYAVKV